MHVFGITVRAEHTAARDVTVDAHDAMRWYAVTQQAAGVVELIAVFTVLRTLDLNQGPHVITLPIKHHTCTQIMCVNTHPVQKKLN